MAYKNKQKQKEYQRTWMQKRRQAYFQNKLCAICGIKKQLELDHINPKLKISNSIWSWKLEKRERELKKCQVLCHKHHVEKTNKERKKIGLIHGTTTGYSNPYKCRCNLCRKANTEATRKYRSNKKLHSGTSNS